MDFNDIKKSIFNILKESGYKKKGNRVYKIIEGNIILFDLQKSNFSESFYVNYGFYINDINSIEKIPKV